MNRDEYNECVSRIKQNIWGKSKRWFCKLGRKTKGIFKKADQLYAANNKVVI